MSNHQKCEGGKLNQSCTKQIFMKLWIAFHFEMHIGISREKKADRKFS